MSKHTSVRLFWAIEVVPEKPMVAPKGLNELGLITHELLGVLHAGPGLTSAGQALLTVSKPEPGILTRMSPSPAVEGVPTEICVPAPLEAWPLTTISGLASSSDVGAGAVNQTSLSVAAKLRPVMVIVEPLIAMPVM